MRLIYTFCILSYSTASLLQVTGYVGHSFTLAEEVTCMVYDSLIMFSSLEVPCCPSGEGPDSISVQKVVLQTLLNQTCQWVSIYYQQYMQHYSIHSRPPTVCKTSPNISAILLNIVIALIIVQYMLLYLWMTSQFAVSQIAVTL